MFYSTKNEITRGSCEEEEMTSIVKMKLIIDDTEEKQQL